MVTKTIDRTDEDKQTYDADKTLKEQIQADENLDEWMSLVEQYSSQDTVQADVLGVSLDDDAISITYRVPIGDVEVEERFNLPYTISDDYEINRLLRTMYGSDVSLSDAVDKLRGEEEIPVEFDLEDGIQGIRTPDCQMEEHNELDDEIEHRIEGDVKVTIGDSKTESTGNTSRLFTYLSAVFYALFLAVIMIYIADAIYLGLLVLFILFYI